MYLYVCHDGRASLSETMMRAKQQILPTSKQQKCPTPTIKVEFGEGTQIQNPGTGAVQLSGRARPCLSSGPTTKHKFS